MLDFLAGEAVTITAPFTRGGEPFVPDDGSVTWSLRGQDGATLVTPTAIAGVTDTFVAIDIDAAHHSLSGAGIFEKRTITVRATEQGAPYSWSASYRIHTWLNLSTSQAAIRSFIGCDATELPDEDIDLLGAYLKVADRAGASALVDALNSGTIRELHANNAITAQAVLDALPGLGQRLAKKESDGNRNVERFSLDLGQLERQAREALRAGLEAITAVIDTTVTPTLFIVASRTDPVTGT